MVLPTYALAQHGTQIHAACWPGRLRSGNGTARWPDQHLLSRAFALQTGAYVLCAGTTLSRDSVPEKYREFLVDEFKGGSAVIDPLGDVIAGPVEGEELVLADCSLAQVRAAKVAFDCAGHSSRQDQLALQNFGQGDQQDPMSMGGPPPEGFDPAQDGDQPPPSGPH
jgi:predicted amidohydrolase